MLSKIVRAAGTLAIAMACGAANAEDVRVGAVFPMSGPNATYGDLFMAGASLAADHANAEPGPRERLDANDPSVADLGVEGAPVRVIRDKSAGHALHRRAGRNSSV